MNVFTVLLLSFVEGITEYLPVSSTGHLILTAKLLGVEQTEFVKSFEIFIQLGAVLAVFFYYGPRLIRMKSVWKPVVAAFIPTALFGFVLYKFIKEFLLGNIFITAASLFAGGILFILLEKFYFTRHKPRYELQTIPLAQAVFIGVIQSLSVVPGISRSGASIIGSMLLGLSRGAAVEFSFLLAVPTIVAASALDMLKSHWEFTSIEYIWLLLGFLGAFITALFTLKFFIRFVAHHTLIPFGIYRIAVALLFFFFIL